MVFGLNVIVDIIVLCFVIFGYYQAKKGQFFVELFSLSGVLITTLMTLHYYTYLSGVITKRFLIPDTISQISVYVFLVVIFGFLLTIGLESLVAVFKLEAHPSIDKFGGMLLGLVKYFFVAALVFFGLFVSQQKVLVKAANNSISQFIFRNVSVNFYQVCFDYIIARIDSDAKFNMEAFEVAQ